MLLIKITIYIGFCVCRRSLLTMVFRNSVYSGAFTLIYAASNNRKKWTNYPSTFKRDVVDVIVSQPRESRRQLSYRRNLPRLLRLTDWCRSSHEKQNKKRDRLIFHVLLQRRTAELQSPNIQNYPLYAKHVSIYI